MEIISKEFIKPVSPTLNHLKTYEYSIFDQVALPNYIPILLCFPPPPSKQNNAMINSSRSKHLKKSLSEILTHYYFLAGRLTTNNFVNCNDEGVPFVEALVHKNLEDVLNNPHDENKLRKSLVPLTLESFASPFLLSVQVSWFECGGMVLGISASHKVLDACSFSTFITDWTSLARGDHPNFVLNPIAKLIPAISDLPHSPATKDDFPNEACVTNVYVFNPSSIADLKMKVASKGIPKPSRVEIVTSVLWKFLTANSNKSLLLHMVNMRKRVDPPMDAHCIGNFVAPFVASNAESGKDVADLVSALRKGLVEFDNNYMKRMKGDEAIGTTLELLRDSLSMLSTRDDVGSYQFSSWCGYSFYDVDFGWGKPIMFTTTEVNCKDLIFLIDTKDGGVEALVTLSEEDMKMFDKNSTELLTYATLKASIPHKEK